MTALGLGDIAAFPFVDPPDRRNITDGVDLLHELGALDPAEADPASGSPPLGRQLAQLPVDPRLARMVLEADRNGCVREVLVIAAALSIQDPRERPPDTAGAGRRSSTPGSPTRSRTSSPTSTCGTTCGSSSRSCRPASSAGCASASSSTTCGSASGRTCIAQLRQVAHADSASPLEQRRAGRPAERAHRRCWPACCRTSACRTREQARVPRRPRRPVRDLPRLGAVQEAAALGDGGRAGRDVPAVGPGRRADRAGVGRAARRAPGQAQLQRAALGEASRPR